MRLHRGSFCYTGVMATIAVEVPPSIAARYAGATAEQRRRLNLLVSLQLEAFLSRPPRDIGAVMDEIGRQAEANGLDESKLKEILGDLPE